MSPNPCLYSTQALHTEHTDYTSITHPSHSDHTSITAPSPVEALLAVAPPLEHGPPSSVVHVTVDAQGSGGAVRADHIEPAGHVTVGEHLRAV